eukprot:CAMPEP_0201284896 /NCGR_PEP_ID=MMETSP1317-20130820/88498_1 /ASSEMBLY_ACC=CAM_ASM_000770 /TAXON_ID=187299 /ORGANISM="Undescribed Undescribed, Strain Undescribed" /LENGTH=36 /DNA_ID= /DNA_START= /DNA_END= /DNA_ORIENTATION=
MPLIGRLKHMGFGANDSIHFDPSNIPAWAKKHIAFV